MTDTLPPYDPSIYYRLCPGDRWIFRWRFEFFGEKPARVGGWYPATRVEDMASSVNKENLSRAIIEGKHWTTREVKIFAEVPGEDFINFQHLAVCVLDRGYVEHHVYGMKIEARTCLISVLENGVVNYEARQIKGNHLYPEWTRF